MNHPAGELRVGACATPLPIADSIAEALPTSTATTIVDDVTGATCTDTTTPPGRVNRTRARQRSRSLKGTSDNPFLTPPEAFVKDQPDLYQPCYLSDASAAVGQGRSA